MTMTDAEDIDLLALRAVLLAALDDLISEPPGSPTRAAAVRELSAALRRVAAVAGASRRAAREGAVMLARIVSAHRK